MNLAWDLITRDKEDSADALVPAGLLRSDIALMSLFCRSKAAWLMWNVFMDIDTYGFAAFPLPGLRLPGFW